MSNENFIFERLDVYQRAVDFADRIYMFTQSFPKSELYGVISQIRRAALSVSLNIAEGSGRRHTGEKRQFFIMARASVFECVPLLEISKRRGYIKETDRCNLYGECQELSRMIMGLVKSIS